MCNTVVWTQPSYLSTRRPHQPPRTPPHWNGWKWFLPFGPLTNDAPRYWWRHPFLMRVEWREGSGVERVGESGKSWRKKREKKGFGSAHGFPTVLHSALSSLFHWNTTETVQQKVEEEVTKLWTKSRRSSEQAVEEAVKEAVEEAVEEALNKQSMSKSKSPMHCNKKREWKESGHLRAITLKYPSSSIMPASPAE